MLSLINKNIWLNIFFFVYDNKKIIYYCHGTENLCFIHKTTLKNLQHLHKNLDKNTIMWTLLWTKKNIIIIVSNKDYQIYIKENAFNIFFKHVIFQFYSTEQLGTFYFCFYSELLIICHLIKVSSSKRNSKWKRDRREGKRR